MRKITSILLLVSLVFSLAACGSHTMDANIQDQEPAEQAKMWIEAQMENNTLFSLGYDGKDYAKHIKNWKKTRSEEHTSELQSR